MPHYTHHRAPLRFLMVCTPTLPSSTYPTSTFNSANYWVDVLYAKATTYSAGGR